MHVRALIIDSMLWVWVECGGLPVIIFIATTATNPEAVFIPGCMVWGVLLIILSEDRGHVSGDKG